MTTSTATQPRTFKPGDTVCWKMISGVDISGKPIYGIWASGTVIGPGDSEEYLFVRRSIGGCVLVEIDRVS